MAAHDAAAALVLTALFLLPTGAPASAPPRGTPSADPAYPPRLLGGEAFVYQFDEGDFETRYIGSVLDVSPFGGDAYRAGSTVVEGPNGLGKAVYLTPGRALYIENNTGANTLQDDFTLMLWTASTYNGYCCNPTLFGAGTGNAVTLALYHHNGDLYAYVRDSQGIGRTYGLGHVLTGAWEHLALVKAGLQLKFYVDGALVSDQAASPGLWKGTPIDTESFGTYPYADWYYGYLDEGRLYDRSLSADDINSIKDFPYVAPNIPPVADAGPDATIPCTGPTTTVRLDGTGSHDDNGDALTYAWTGASVASPAAPATEATLPLGTTTATLTVSDGLASDGDAVAVRVVDFTPPVITATFPDATGVYAGDKFVAVQPSSDRVVLGAVNVTAAAQDLCSSVAAVRFTVDDGTDVLDATAPFGFTYRPEGLGVQYRTLRIVAIDAFGNASPATEVPLTVVATAPRLPASLPAAPPVPPSPTLPPLPALPGLPAP